MPGGGDLGRLTVELDALTARFDRSIQGSDQRLVSLNSQIVKIGISAAAVFAAGSIAINKLTNVASDAAEQMNVIVAGFGDLTPSVLEWADTTADAVGRSTFQMKDFAATTQAMLAPMLGSADAASEMSKNIATLSVDMGSFFNAVDTDVLLAIKSGLVGSSEPMRKFGVVMTQASLQAFALEKGIRTSVKEMSEGAKVALRYAFIMDKTRLAQGDSAKTAESYANLTKRLSGQIKDLAADLGKFLLPAAERWLMVGSRILTALQNLSPETKRWAAIILTTVTAIAGIVAAASAIVVILPALKAGLAAIGGVIAAVAAGLSGLAVPLLGIAALMIGWLAVIGTFKDAFVRAFDAVSKKVEEWATNIKKLESGALDAIVEAAEKAGKAVLGISLKGAAKSAARAGRGLVKGAGEVGGGVVDTAVEGLVAFKAAVIEGAKTVGEFTGATGALKTASEFLGGGLDDLGDLLNIDTEKALKDALKLVDSLGKSAGEAGESLADMTKGFGVIKDSLIPNLQEMDRALNAATTATFEGAGEEGFLGGLGAVTDRMELEAEDAVMTAGESLSAGAAKFADGVIGELGKAGNIIQGAMEGFQAGGPVGAIVGAIVGLLLSLESIMAAIKEAVRGFDALIGAFSGIFDFLPKLFESLNEVLLPLFEGLGEAFSTVGEVITRVFQSVGGFLETIGKAIGPLFDVIGSLVEAFASFAEIIIVLLESFGFIKPIMDAVAAAVKVFGDAMREIASVLDAVAGWMRDAAFDVGTAFEDLGAEIEDAFDIESERGFEGSRSARSRRQAEARAEVRKDPAAHLRRQAEMAEAFGRKSLAGQLSRLADSFAAIVPPEIIPDDLPVAMDGFIDALTDATEALTNVPEGFKIAAARFAATNVGLNPAVAGAGPLGVGGRVFQIEQLIVQSDDPDAMAAQLEQRSRRANFISGGTTERNRNEFEPSP